MFKIENHIYRFEDKIACNEFNPKTYSKKEKFINFKLKIFILSLFNKKLASKYLINKNEKNILKINKQLKEIENINAINTDYQNQLEMLEKSYFELPKQLKIYSIREEKILKIYILKNLNKANSIYKEIEKINNETKFNNYKIIELSKNRN